MKNFIFLFILFCSVIAFGQNQDEISLLANTRTLNQTVFGSKDSVVLKGLFFKELSYGHSSGKVENRQDAIHNISNNTSTYSELTTGPVNLWIENKTGITRHLVTANELTKDGKINPLKLHIMLVWVKEKSGWKLMARQAVRVQ